MFEEIWHRLLAGDPEVWFWAIIGPLAIFGVLYGRRSAGGDDGGGSADI